MSDPATVSIVMIAASVGAAAASAALRPKPPRTGSTAGKHPEIDIPSVDMGSPIPVLWGTQDMKGTIIYPRDPSQAAIMMKHDVPAQDARSGGSFGGGVQPGVTAESTYRMIFQIAYCWGIVERLISFKVDDRTIWSYVGDTSDSQFGTMYGYPLVESINQSSPYAPNITGGASGGWGECLVFPGLSSQDNASLISSFTVDPATQLPVEDPYYKNIFYVMYGVDNGSNEHTGFWNVGSSARVPNITVRAFRAPDTVLFSNLNADGSFNSTDGRTQIIETSRGLWEANPICVALEALMNPRWGAGIPEDKFDLNDWANAALLMKSERKWGISVLMDSQTDAATFCDDVMRHINAGIVKRQNKWGVRLIDKSYSFADIPHIHEDAIADWKYSPGQPTQVTNFASVEFTNASRNYKPTTVPMADISSIQTLDVSRRETVNLPFFTSEEVARAAARQHAIIAGTPHDVIEFSIKRKDSFVQCNGAGAPDLNGEYNRMLEWGDVVFPRYPLGGFVDGNRPYRIIKIEHNPKGINGYLRLTMVEEVPVFTDANALTNIDPTPPSEAPQFQVVDITLPLELPYAEEINSPSETRITVLAKQEDTRYSQFAVYGGTTSEISLWTAAGEFVPYGTVEGFYGNGVQLDFAGLKLREPLDSSSLYTFAVSGSVTRAQMFMGYRRAVLVDNDDNWEIINFKDITIMENLPTQLTGRLYALSGLLRNRDDTARLSNPTKCFILPTGAFPFYMSSNQRSEFYNGATLKLKVAPYNTLSAADASEQPLETLTVTTRSQRPYPVSTIAIIKKVGGVPSGSWMGRGRVPIFTDTTTTVRILWQARSRTGGWRRDTARNDLMQNYRSTIEGDFQLEMVYPSAYNTDDVRTTTVNPSPSFIWQDAMGTEWFYYDEFSIVRPAHTMTCRARVWSRNNGLLSLTPAEINFQVQGLIS